MSSRSTAGAAQIGSLLEHVDLDLAAGDVGLPLGTFTGEELLAVGGPDGGVLPVGDRLEGIDQARDAVLDAAVRSLVGRGALVPGPDGRLAASGPLGVVLAAREHSGHVVVAERFDLTFQDVTAFYAVDAGRPLLLEEQRTEGDFHVMTLWDPVALFGDLRYRWGLHADEGEADDTPDVVRVLLDADRLPVGDDEGSTALRADLGGINTSIAVFAARPSEDGRAGPREARVAFVDAASGRHWALVDTGDDPLSATAHRLRSLDVDALLDACFGADLEAYG